MRKKIRICNVDEEGRFGGPERRIIQVASSLESFNIETYVLYPILDSARFSSEISKLGLVNFQLDITRLSKERRMMFRYVWRFLPELWLLIRFFRTHSIDLVHVNGAYQFKTAIAAKLSGVPVVWHLNNTQVDSIIKRIFYIIAPWAASGFVVAGERVFDYYLSQSKLRSFPVAEIHAPVDFSVFKFEHHSEIDEAEVDSSLTILSVSGVNPVKGVEYFVEVADRIVQGFSGIKFQLAGARLQSQVEYSNFIDELIYSSKLNDDNFEELGLVENVPSLLDAADICVFTSVAEASPTAIWEAMAMGKAIVTTDVGSVRQYIVDGESGYIVPVADVDALEERISRLIINKSDRISFGLAAKRVAEEKLSVEMAAKLHNSIYRRLLQTDS